MPSISLIFRDDEATGSVTMEFVPSEPMDVDNPSTMTPAQRVGCTAAAMLSDMFANKVSPTPAQPPTGAADATTTN